MTHQGDDPNAYSEWQSEEYGRQQPRGQQPPPQSYQGPGGAQQPTQRPPGQQPPGHQPPGQQPPAQQGQQPQPMGTPPQTGQAGTPQSTQQPPGQQPPGQQPPGQQQPGHQPPAQRGQQTAGMGATQMGTAQQPGGGQGMQARPQPTQQAPAGRPQLRPVTVEEIVQTDVVTAQRDTPIVTLVAEMAQRDVGSVVIVEDDTPVDIVTDRQIALALESTPDLADRQADELVGGDLVTGTTDMSVFDALRRLSDGGIRRLPIVGEDGALEGIVTLDDILVLLGAELGNATEIIRAQAPRF